MQLTFSTDDPLDRVVAAVEAIYGVRLEITHDPGGPQADEDPDVPDVPDDHVGGKVRQDKT